jgi:hypothetical protein
VLIPPHPTIQQRSFELIVTLSFGIQRSMRMLMRMLRLLEVVNNPSRSRRIGVDSYKTVLGVSSSLCRPCLPKNLASGVGNSLQLPSLLLPLRNQRYVLFLFCSCRQLQNQEAADTRNALHQTEGPVTSSVAVKIWRRCRT